MFRLAKIRLNTKKLKRNIYSCGCWFQISNLQRWYYVQLNIY